VIEFIRIRLIPRPGTVRRSDPRCARDRQCSPVLGPSRLSSKIRRSPPAFLALVDHKLRGCRPARGDRGCPSRSFERSNSGLVRPAWSQGDGVAVRERKASTSLVAILAVDASHFALLGHAAEAFVEALVAVDPAVPVEMIEPDDLGPRSFPSPSPLSRSASPLRTTGGVQAVR